MRSSTAAQRRKSSSTSGWSSAAASTRAITRRCSVMRMPLAVHRFSMFLGFGAFTTLLRPIEISRLGGRDPSGPGDREPVIELIWSHEVAAKDQGGSTACGGIVALAAANLSEPGALIEPPRRHVALLDFEKDRTRAETRQS